MRIIRVIIGAILLFIGIYFSFFWIRSFLTHFELFGIKGFLVGFFLNPFLAIVVFSLIFGILLIGRKISTSSIISTFLGIIAIIGGIVSFYIGPAIGMTSLIMATIVSFILFFVGGLAILPIKFYKKPIVRKMRHFFSIVLIFTFIFDSIFFLILFPEKFSGDFMIIPFYLLGSLLIGCFCLPFLIIKSKKAEKILKQDINNK